MVRTVSAAGVGKAPLTPSHCSSAIVPATISQSHVADRSRASLVTPAPSK